MVYMGIRNTSTVLWLVNSSLSTQTPALRTNNYVYTQIQYALDTRNVQSLHPTTL